VLVKGHGGPTSAASSTLSLSTQYWTSRGIGVLDVNYRGSTGYGRRYRLRLERQWGLVDVEDFTFLSLAGSAYLRPSKAIKGVISESLATPLDVKLLLPLRQSGRNSLKY
jgi:prolyl oligopeptidase family protein